MSNIGYKSFDKTTPDIDLSNALEQMAIERERNDLRTYTLLMEAARRIHEMATREKQPND